MFGLSHVHIDTSSRSKLDPKPKKCLFIGYGDAKFGYHFWDDQNRKIVRSRDVILNRKLLYKDKLSMRLEGACHEIKKAEIIPLNDIPVNEIKTMTRKIKKS